MGITSLFFTVLLILLLTNLSMAVHASIKRASALKINKAGPYIGLIMADQTEEQTLLAAGVFLPCTKTPWLDFSGRRFNIGSIDGQKIIYVRCGQRRLNAGVSTQMLIDLFDIAGVVHYGTAGNANDSLSIGDVSIPKYFAYTGSWKWTGLKLEGCVNSTFCLPEAPKVVVGLKASTADIFVDNAAFRKFLFNQFQVASADEESAAIVMICQSSSVPVAVFRGLSDLAGGDKENVSSMFSSLAAKNALTAALAFLSLLQNATQGRVSNALQFIDI